MRRYIEPGRIDRGLVAPVHPAPAEELAMTIPGGERAFALHALQGEVLVIDDRGTLAFGVDATERARAAEAPASDEHHACRLWRGRARFGKRSNSVMSGTRDAPSSSEARIRNDSMETTVSTRESASA
jgi:hypothetical protein